MPDFLFEIGSEEIPSRFQKNARDQLRTLAHTCLSPTLHAKSIDTCVTPRRLSLILEDIALVPEHPYEKQGPSVSGGEKALEGFCKSLGIEVHQCFEKDTPKGKVWATHIVPKARNIEIELIAFCKRILEEFFWGKRMRWETDITWVRPIRRLLCLYGEKALIWDWQELTSGGVSEGHRLWPYTLPHGQNEEILDPLRSNMGSALFITSPASYETQLRDAMVEVRFEKREDTIRHHLFQLAEEIGCSPYEHGLSKLVEENAGLTQWPTGMRGTFDSLFLQLPEEVIATTLHIHQKCFCMKDNATGNLAPYFIMIADGVFFEDKVLKGYERVVDARLSDALFFWHKDRSHSLSFYTPLLEGRVFFDGLGTLAHKVERMTSLVSHLCNQLGIQETEAAHAVQAAQLSKSDLMTSLAGEFADLQGVVGKHYALHDGLDPTIACAIEEHYRFYTLSCAHKGSASRIGALLAIADGIDTLVGFFALGRAPSGSKDPMALRRTAHSVIRACVIADLSFSLESLISYALSCYHAQGYLSGIGQVAHLWPDFFKDRLIYILKEDLDFAEIEVRTALIADCIPDLVKRVGFLRHHLHSAPTFLQVYRRAYSLARQMKDEEATFDEGLLQLPQEQSILELLKHPLQDVDFSAWAKVLTDFFDHVRVNDPVYQKTRLALLRKVISFFSSLGHFSELLPR